MKSLREVQEMFPKAKIVLMVRHGDKDENGLITPECLKNIEEDGIVGLTNEFTAIQFGSSFARTHQTAYAAGLYLAKKGARITKHLQSITDLLNPDFVKQLVTDEVKQLIKAGEPNYKAIHSANYKTLDAWQNLLRVMMKMFMQNFLEAGDVCLSISHSPTVEALYNVFSKEEDVEMQIDPLEGIWLVQPEDGGIIAIR